MIKTGIALILVVPLTMQSGQLTKVHLHQVLGHIPLVNKPIIVMVQNEATPEVQTRLIFCLLIFFNSLSPS